MKYLLIFTLLISSLHGADFLTNYQKFAEKYCFECHDEDVQKGEFRMDNLKLNLADFKNVEKWQSIQQVLVDGDMPPKKKKQPSDELKQNIIQAIDKLFLENEAQLAEETRTLRQLTPYQLQNSVSDLLNVTHRIPKTFSTYPGAIVNTEFDTMGNEMKVTYNQVDSLSKIVRNILTRPTPNSNTAKKKKKSKKNKSHSNTINSEFTLDNVGNTSLLRKLPNGKNAIQVLDHGRMKLGLKSRAGHDLSWESKFRLQLKVKAFNNHEKIPKSLWNKYMNPEESKVGLYQNLKSLVRLILEEKGNSEASNRIILAEYNLNHGEELIIDREVVIPANYELKIRHITAPWKFRHNLTLDSLGYKGFYTASSKSILKDARKQGVLDKYELPNMTFYDMQITELKDPNTDYSQYQDKAKLLEFAERAFRRPLKDDEIRTYYKFLEYENGYIQAIQAILSSPQFIYHTENSGELNAYSLASRLSYSLWGTMPDDRLFKLAADNSLTNEDVLVGEIHRMLDDKKAKSLAEDFMYQWLHLSNIDSMPPDRKKFGIYNKEGFITESKLFFRYLLDNNLSVKNFVNADFTFMNVDLANFYGSKLQEPTASFQKVSLADKPERGGFIGQSAILTASANGVDTSPIVRGIWFSEKMFDIVPPEPPEGVDTTPDTTKGNTIKEILKLHTEDISCSRCHKKIDPLGFSLENYDPIGRWRDKYEDEQPIDPSGEFKNIKFNDIKGLKEGLKDKTALIAEGFVKKFLTYSLGRRMTQKDFMEIKRIVAAAKKSNYGVKDLIVRSITSEIFLKR